MRAAALMRGFRAAALLLAASCSSGFVTPAGDQWDEAAASAFATLRAQGASHKVLGGAGAVARLSLIHI